MQSWKSQELTFARGVFVFKQDLMKIQLFSQGTTLKSCAWAQKVVFGTTRGVEDRKWIGCVCCPFPLVEIHETNQYNYLLSVSMTSGYFSSIQLWSQHTPFNLTFKLWKSHSKSKSARKKECYQWQLHIYQSTFRPINNQLPRNSNNPLLAWCGHLHQPFRIHTQGG